MFWNTWTPDKTTTSDKNYDFRPKQRPPSKFRHANKTKRPSTKVASFEGWSVMCLVHYTVRNAQGTRPELELWVLDTTSMQWQMFSCWKIMHSVKGSCWSTINMLSPTSPWRLCGTLSNGKDFFTWVSPDKRQAPIPF